MMIVTAQVVFPILMQFIIHLYSGFQTVWLPEKHALEVKFHPNSKYGSELVVMRQNHIVVAPNMNPCRKIT
jgi:hypothetical protein